MKEDKNGFNFAHFRGDLFGGITAGIVALPLALAFGESTELGAAAGLYGAILIAFFASLFGGTSTQISGPTAPMTAVSMVIIGGMVSTSGSIEKALPAIIVVFLLAGLIQIALGFAGVGKYIKYIPYPVVSGFMTAIGVIILVTQILPSLGYYPKDDMAYVETFKPMAEEILLEDILRDEAGEGILVLEDFKETINRASEVTAAAITSKSKDLAGADSQGVLGAIKSMPRAFKNINWLELLLALGTIFIIYGFKRITKKIPSTLVALLVMTIIAVAFKLEYKQIAEIPSGIPIPQLGFLTDFNLSSITPYILTAISLALLGAIDSLLTSIVADNMTKTKHNSKKELIGQGVGNSIAALFGGLPGAGATIRTVVNIQAGGKTKLSGMIAGVLLLIILLALGPIASKIPAAVLAGILVTVGIGVMDYKGLKAIPYTPKGEVFVMLVVLVLASTWDLIYAVGIGLVLASIMFMKKIGDLTSEQSAIKSFTEEEAWDDESGIPINLKEEFFVKHINGPLFFGSTSDLQTLANQIPTTATTVIIRMDKVPYMDQSGLYTMEDICLNLVQKDIKIGFVGVKKQPRNLLEQIDLIPNLIPDELIFDRFEDCIEWIKDNVEDIYPR